jgi:ribosomal protein S3
MEIFKNLRKQQHGFYIKFLITFFNVLIFETMPIKELNSPIKGVKIFINGRLKGKQKASTEAVRVGVVPIQSINKNIEFAKGYTFTQNFGVYGFKIWIYRK